MSIWALERHNLSNHSSLAVGNCNGWATTDLQPRSTRSQVDTVKRGLMPLHISLHVRKSGARRLNSSITPDDFETFIFNDLGSLEKANQGLNKNLCAEAIQAPRGSEGELPPELDLDKFDTFLASASSLGHSELVRALKRRNRLLRVRRDFTALPWSTLKSYTDIQTSLASRWRKEDNAALKVQTQSPMLQASQASLPAMEELCNQQAGMIKRDSPENVHYTISRGEEWAWFNPSKPYRR